MRPLAAFVAALAAAPYAAAADGPPFVRTQLTPQQVTVGQAVTLDVDVFVPSYFTGAPRFPQLEVKDAVVVFVDSGLNMNTSVGGASYAGQRRSYLIYPQRAGGHDVPAFAVKVTYGTDSGPSPETAVAAQAGRFEATVPEAARGLEYFIATPSFSLSGTFDRDLTGLKVGDSITRTVTMRATDAFAMMLPPLAFDAEPGLAVYPASPRTSDHPGERGEVRVASRVESATYLLQKEGSYHLPAIDVAWWDTRAKTLRHATIPEAAFEVAAAPAAADAIPLPTGAAPPPPPPDPWLRLRDGLRRYVPWVLAALLVVSLLWQMMRAPLRRLRARGAARRREREESPAAFLEKLRQAARSGQPAELLAATYRWLDRQQPAEASAARLDVFAGASGDPALPRLADGLVAAVLDGTRKEDAAAFEAALVRAAHRAAEPPSPDALGPLNPPAAGES